ncbi:MAG: hypothetical protein EBR82_42220 [Caulobacteraceae bacterium]|nr:hypothetical protein [Caulobacteraceae bacterium]
MVLHQMLNLLFEFHNQLKLFLLYLNFQYLSKMYHYIFLWLPYQIHLLLYHLQMLNLLFEFHNQLILI